MTIPTLDELRLPPVLKDLAMTKRGLIIFVGGTGTGKTTSLAAMVDYRNENSLRSHHHRRRPDRVRARPQELHRHPARGRGRHRRLGPGAEEHAAPGPRRDPDGRNPRPRDHGLRHRLRRNRPPGTGHPARQQRQPGDRPHHQLLPGRAPPATAHGPVAQPARHGVAAPDPEEGRQGPYCGHRSDAQLAADFRPDLQGRGASRSRKS